MISKEFYISCLTALIKFSCPWYLRRWIYQKIVRPFFLILFWIATVILALLPLFEHNILHQATIPQYMLRTEIVKKFEPDFLISEELTYPGTIEEFERILLTFDDSAAPGIIEEFEPDFPIFESPSQAELVKEFEQHFPIPEDLTYHVEFWKAVFTRYTSRHVILHDNWYPQIVYKIIDLDTSSGIGSTIQKYKRVLLSLHQKEQAQTLDSLTPLEAEVYKKFANISERERFKKAAHQRIRAQCGQRDSFMRAIQRSGLYQTTFEQIFRKYDLPIGLTRLPFIESYFNPKAYSSAGAAGLWQFMPATARMYGLQVNQKIDERYDPFKAADSAARLLRANYEIFQSWPLAVTAYNYGPAGLIKAIKELDTKDLGKIAKTYRGARFGFYSRNFYVQFLATAQIMLDYERYFGHIERLSPLRYESVTIAQTMFINDIASDLSIPEDALITLNKDLKRAIIHSKAPLPKNFLLKLPPGKKSQFIKQYANL